MGKLIIVEGLPCSGKSSTAKYIAEKLGYSFVDEGTGSHPADYEFHAFLTENDLMTFAPDERGKILSLSERRSGGYIVRLGDFTGKLFEKLLQYKIYDSLPWETEKPVMLDFIAHRLDVYNNQKLAPFGITHSQAKILVRLAHSKDGRLAQSELKAFGRRGSTITSILTNLEKAGFIKRTASKSDARAKFIEITDKGREVQQTAFKNILELDMMIDSLLTDKESAALSQLLEKIAMLRRIVPNIALRTSLITGFPGESEKDHKELVEFIKNVRFDRLGVFKYSAEENTPAASFEDQIPEDVMDERFDELMSIQQEIAFEKARKRVDDVVEVMIEGEIPEEEVYIGRTRIDAPNIDGCVFLPMTERFMTGDICRARVTGARDYDLLAVPAL